MRSKINEGVREYIQSGVLLHCAVFKSKSSVIITITGLYQGLYTTLVTKNVSTIYSKL